MNLTSPIQLTNNQTQDVVAATGTSPYALGTQAITHDGRRFRWAQAGAVDLVVGNVIQAAAEIALHQTCAVAAAAIGATTVTVTPGATAGAENLYANGLLIVSVTPGIGYAYNISSHLAITASVAFVVNLSLDDPIQVALTTSSKVTLLQNPWKNVIQAPVTTLTGAVVGVAVSIIPALGWGWLQVGGPCSVLVKGTPGPGVAVVSPGSAAGAVVVDGAAAATQVVGAASVTGVDAQCMPVHLNLP